MIPNRRTFLQSLIGVAGLSAGTAAWATDYKPAAYRRPIACNQYAWHTFYQRDGKSWAADLDASLAAFAQSGLVGYEPSFTSVAEVHKLAPLLKKYGLQMRSFYVNSALHKADEAKTSIETALAIADAAKPLGTNVVVTNPNPLKWGGAESKTDDELITQAQYLNQLGAELKKRGMTLAYHTHDVEMRHAAREFHHMLQATDPANVSLCLDVHWVYRGSGNSQVALFDIVKMYGKRIALLHLRQSKNHVWIETFGPGDIDYARLANELKTMKVEPYLVLEQCLEKESPNTIDVVSAHRQDLAYVKQIFG